MDPPFVQTAISMPGPSCAAMKSGVAPLSLVYIHALKLPDASVQEQALASNHRYTAGKCSSYRGEDPWIQPHSQTPGRIQKRDPPQGSAIYTIGVLDSRIGGSTFWILRGLGSGSSTSIMTRLKARFVNVSVEPQQPAHAIHVTFLSCQKQGRRAVVRAGPVL